MWQLNKWLQSESIERTILSGPIRVDLLRTHHTRCLIASYTMLPTLRLQPFAEIEYSELFGWEGSYHWQQAFDKQNTTRKSDSPSCTSLASRRNSSMQFAHVGGGYSNVFGRMEMTPTWGQDSTNLPVYDCTIFPNRFESRQAFGPDYSYQPISVWEDLFSCDCKLFKVYHPETWRRPIPLHSSGWVTSCDTPISKTKCLHLLPTRIHT